MQKWIQDEQNTQIVTKRTPNAPPEASKWARRPEDGSRGAKMVSMRLQKLPKDPKMAQRGPKLAHMAHNMAPRGAKMAPKGPKVGPRWPQNDSKRLQKEPRCIPKLDSVCFGAFITCAFSLAFTVKNRSQRTRDNLCWIK